MFRVYLQGPRERQPIFASGWMAAALALGLVVLGFFVLAVGAALALVLAPVALALALAARWRLRRAFNEFSRASRPQARSDRIIEADYRVLDDRERR